MPTYMVLMPIASNLVKPSFSETPNVTRMTLILHERTLQSILITGLHMSRTTAQATRLTRQVQQALAIATVIIIITTGMKTLPRDPIGHAISPVLALQ